MSTKPEKQNRNNSILYLALLCLVYFLLSHWSGSRHIFAANEVNSGKQIYVEINEDHTSTVVGFGNFEEVEKYSYKHNIEGKLGNGYKVILKDGKGVITGRISGVKSLSLDIPIGINTAGKTDLAALPGIGETLAGRILDYREQIGGFTKVKQLLNVYGLGEKKLSAVSNLVSLD